MKLSNCHCWSVLLKTETRDQPACQLTCRNCSRMLYSNSSLSATFHITFILLGVIGISDATTGFIGPLSVPIGLPKYIHPGIEYCALDGETRDPTSLTSMEAIEPHRYTQKSEWRWALISVTCCQKAWASWWRPWPRIGIASKFSRAPAYLRPCRSLP